MKVFRIAALVLFAGFILAAATPANADPSPDPRFGEWITIFDGTQNLEDDWFISKPLGKVFNWKVEEDGSMTNMADPNLPKHNIATKRKFHNFEAELEFKISEGGNSGIYMRGRAEIQIKDSHGKDELDKQDMGALYKYVVPMVDATKPAGEWNHIYIRFIGTHVTAILNGKLIHDNQYTPKKTGAGRMDKFDSPGIFELQGDHDKVWFRNIKIRPLFEAEGWRPLFNGKDTTGWTASNRYGYPKAGGENRWVVKDGTITNDGKHIVDGISEEQFGDFLVYYEYKSDGNSGVFLRDKWEIQIDASYGIEPNKNSDGALYDFYPPMVSASNPNDQWNNIQAKLEGRKITVFQNNILTHKERECDGRTYNPGWKTDLDTPGGFRIQGDHGPAWFTNFWVLPLD